MTSIKANQKLLITVVLILVLINLCTVNIMAQSNKSDIELNFNGVDLRDAFRALADLVNMNIIVDNSVQGTVTVSLNDVSFIKAMELLTKTNGLDYQIIDNTVVIATSAKLQTNFKEKKTRIFKLKNSNPKEISNTLEMFINQDAIKIDKRTKSLIITAYPKKIKEIAKVINKLDEPSKQVMIQARIEDISYSKMKNLGIDWAFNWEEDAQDGTTSIGVGDISIDYSKVLNMLKQTGDDSTTLANPRLATVDGKEAMINIGQEVPIVKKTSEDEVSVEFRDVGTVLKLIPQINSNNQINLNIKPEVSNVSEWVEGYPIIDTKKVETNIMVEDGETIVIAGLISENEIEKLSKIPILGDMPILGELFKSRNNTTEKRELVIFITPRIINRQVKKFNTENSAKEVIAFSYQLEEKDTLIKLKNLFNLDLNQIVKYNQNQLSNKKVLKAKDTLKVPVPVDRYYTVQSGDTLLTIARKYGLKTEELRKINKPNSVKLTPGTKIVLPIEINQSKQEVTEKEKINDKNKIEK